MTEAAIDRPALQRRTIRVLQTGVIPGGLAMTSSFSATALLGKQMTGSETQGALAAVCLSIGGFLAGIPIARVMAKHGRRIGLRNAYGLGAIGATIAMCSALFEIYALLVIGIMFVGVGQAANLAARYAGADLATDEDRAKSISLVMWAGTIGSVLGPTVGLGVKELFGDGDSVSGFAIPYAFAIVLFIVAAASIHTRLRPDPLLVAAGDGDGATFRAPNLGDLGRIIRHPLARIALAGMMLSQAVMVGVMTVTPIHMQDGDQSDIVIGMMMSMHIVGMFAFSPVMGRLADRFGGEAMIGAGAVMLAIGSEIAASTDAPHATGHITGLFLIGLGWSAAVVAGSSLLTASFELGERVGVQATADVLMTATGAIAGISSGAAVEQRGFGDLAHFATFVGVGLGVIAALAVLRRYRVGHEVVTTG